MPTKTSETFSKIPDGKLIQTLVDDQASLNARKAAARALGNRKVERAQEALIAAVQHPDMQLARAARIALEKVSRAVMKKILDEHRKAMDLFARELEVGRGNKGLEAVLINVSLPIEIQVKAFAIAGHRHFVKAVPHLLRVIAGGDPRLVWAAAHALIELGRQDVTQRLIRIVSTPSSEASLAAAIYTLGFVGDKRAEPILIRIAERRMRGTDHTRSVAVEAVAKVSRSRRSFDTITKALHDASDEVRTAAKYALQVFTGHSKGNE